MADEETGRRFASARVLRGLTQRGLARELGVSDSKVSRIEQGGVDPSLNLTRRWARVCGVKVTELAGEVNRG